MTTINKWFAGFETPEAIKIRYRKLAMKYHPDRGGDVEAMQEINAQYQDALKYCDGQTSEDNGKEYTYRYQAEVEQAIMEKIAELLSLNMSQVDVALIGVWIWITGDTKPVKDSLKEAGCKWHTKRKCWYWHNGKKRRSYSKAGLGQIAEKYGYRHFGKTQEQLA